MAENQSSKLTSQLPVVNLNGIGERLSGLTLTRGKFEPINQTARNLYIAHGEYLAESYDFSKALSPLAKRCWAAAVLAYHNTIQEIPGLEALFTAP